MSSCASRMCSSSCHGECSNPAPARRACRQESRRPPCRIRRAPLPSRARGRGDREMTSSGMSDYSHAFDFWAVRSGARSLSLRPRIVVGLRAAGIARRAPGRRRRPRPSRRCGPPAARRCLGRAPRGSSRTARSSRCSDRCRPARTAGTSSMSVSQSLSDRRSVSAPTASPCTTTAKTRPARWRG